jgi:hypothetical protein
MTNELEQHLRDLGVIPTDIFEEAMTVDFREEFMAKGYFNDPRDPVTGEVPF